MQPKTEKLHTLSKKKTGSWQWLPCSDHGMNLAHYCQIQASKEESRENHRPFRYDLIQIPYNYTVEVTNRFKRLALIDRVPEELWTEVHNIVQETVIKTIPKKKKYKKAK